MLYKVAPFKLLDPLLALAESILRIWARVRCQHRLNLWLSFQLDDVGLGLVEVHAKRPTPETHPG